MPRPIATAVLIALAVLSTASSSAARDAEPVNLLTLPAAKLEHASDPAVDGATLRSLRDGDPSTAVTFAATDQSPLTMDFGFGGNVVFGPEGRSERRNAGAQGRSSN